MKPGSAAEFRPARAGAGLLPASLVLLLLAVSPAVSSQEEGGDEPVRLSPVRVTATRAAPSVEDPSVSVREVGRAERERSAARSVDDLLRRVPGFSLFRRLGSSAAHPTTQGVSLRGIGASGASRALVLVDGVPLNDPFGGWVTWSRLPWLTIDRIDVVRGSGASLWGNYAMGGVVGIHTTPPGLDGQGMLAEGGERGLARTEAWAARRVGATSTLVDGRWMSSADFPLVREDFRGAVDRPGGSEHGGGGMRVHHDLSSKSRLRLGARGFHETRDNGTPLRGNETTMGWFHAGLDAAMPGGGLLRTETFATVQDFSSTFSAVEAGRATERPAADQFDVPSTSVGGSLVWSGELADVHRLTAGLDTLWVEAKSRENGRYLDGAYTRLREGGATQLMGGLFVSDVVRASPTIDVSGALRVDYWRSDDGFRRESDLGTGAVLSDRPLAGRDAVLVSPRFGVAWAATDRTTLRGAVYRGFRAPTINEQVRPFRVGNDITEANESLRPEKLFGVEGGFDHERERWRWSATAYWNEIDDPVFNVTVGEGPGVVVPCGFVPDGGSCRQRRNLGRTTVFGLEAEAAVDLGAGLSATVAWLYTDGEVDEADDAPDLVGNRLPQVPRHQGVLGLDYDRGGDWRGSVQVRMVGRQYEDDANSRSLGGFGTVDAFVARRITSGFEVFAAAENLLDQTIESGRAADGLVSIAAPRLVRVGVRYQWRAGEPGGG